MAAQHIAADLSFDAGMLQRAVIRITHFGISTCPVTCLPIIRPRDEQQDSHAQADQSGLKIWKLARKCYGLWPLWGLSQSAVARHKHVIQSPQNSTFFINTRGVA